MDFVLILHLLSEARHDFLPAVDGIAAKLRAPLLEFVPLEFAHVRCLHVHRDQNARKSGWVHANLVHECFNAILAHDRLTVVVLLGDPVENSLGHALVKCFCGSSWLLQLDSVREEVINCLVDIPVAKSDAV